IKYFKQHDFYLAEGARALLTDSIEGLLGGKQFNGFTTIKQLANDILFNLLTSNTDNREITEKQLGGFARDSAYIKRIKAFANNNGKIGFDAAFDDH
ncbi:MAG: hypothetical protein FWE82_09230, partial [Defluviitaleaceae bacterium]|nr:hypothetical protein [Defluviitaleaceae bacterium]